MISTKLKKILLITSFFVYGHLYSSEKYSFTEYELPNNVVKKGGFELTYSEDGFLEADVKAVGDQSSYIFKSILNIPPAGFNIFDLKDPNQVMGISLFTLSIDPSIDYKSFKKTRAVETLDRTHPYFKDQNWNFAVSFKGYEQITLSGNDFNTIHLYTNGDRATGPEHCMYGGYGVIDIDSWYSKETGKLLKQVFIKRNCRPYDYKYLVKEVLELVPGNAGGSGGGSPPGIAPGAGTVGQGNKGEVTKPKKGSVVNVGGIKYIVGEDGSLKPSD